MDLKTLRQIFKSCGDDTRLRIINIIGDTELTVKDICCLLDINQPTVSKHLTRLRLVKVVVDRREGNLVYYSLNKNKETPQGKVNSFINKEFASVELFLKDKKRKKLKK